MNVTIKITGAQGLGKTTMANLIADMCKAHDLHCLVFDGTRPRTRPDHVDALIIVGDPVADYTEALPIHDGITRIG